MSTPTGTLTVTRNGQSYAIEVEIHDTRELFGRKEYLVAQPNAPHGARHWITSVVPHEGTL